MCSQAQGRSREVAKKGSLKIPGNKSMKHGTATCTITTVAEYRSGLERSLCGPSGGSCNPDGGAMSSGENEQSDDESPTPHWVTIRARRHRTLARGVGTAGQCHGRGHHDERLHRQCWSASKGGRDSAWPPPQGRRLVSPHLSRRMGISSACDGSGIGAGDNGQKLAACTVWERWC